MSIKINIDENLKRILDETEEYNRSIFNPIENTMFEAEEFLQNMFLDDDNDEDLREFVSSPTFDINFRYKHIDNITPIMLCCRSMYYEGIKILIENGANLFLLDDFGNSAFSILINSYNNEIERINEGCDNFYLVCFIESIRRGIANPFECLDFNLYTVQVEITEILKLPPIISNADLLIELKKLISSKKKHGLDVFDTNIISKDEICSIIVDISNSEFNGHITIIDKILNLFDKYGINMNTKYSNGSTIQQCFDNNYINCNDSRFHTFNPNIRLYGVKFLIKEGVNTEGLLEYIENKILLTESSNKIEGLKANLEIIKIWIQNGNDNFNMYKHIIDERSSDI